MAAPAFTQVEPPRSRGWLGILFALVFGLGLGVAAYQTRELWLPRVTALGRPAPLPAKPPYIGLNTLDLAGQLQIRWDRDSPAVRRAEQGTLVIDDGALQQAIQLDPAHLQAGSFTYGRQGERVDVALTVTGPDGQKVREVATYLGKLPGPQSPEDEEAGKDRNALVKELQSQKARTKKLEKSVDDMRLELRRQQKRKRLENQSPETVKQE